MSLIAKENYKTNITLTKPSASDAICSSYIDFQNPQHVIIDGIYSGSLLVTNYSREMESLFLDKIQSLDIDLNISMYYQKQNSYEVIKELTYTIGNVGADIKTSSENQQDMDVVGSVYGDAKYIRKQLQLGDEQLFYLSIQIVAFSKTKEGLERDLERVESVAISCGLTTIRANFRQEQALKSIMPFKNIDEDIFKITRRNVLTSGLCSTYPFASNVMFDKNGVLVGTNSFDKTVLMLDRFETSKYKNANMFVVGTSGSGKSYFVKLMINRNRFINVNQFVIDPDREYKKLCESLDGTLINFGANQVINPFDIRKTDLEENESYLMNKISKLKIFFSMIFENMKEDEKAILEDALIKMYGQFGITRRQFFAILWRFK